MQNVIVTITLSQTPGAKDFEIPASMKAADIISHMQEPFKLRKASISNYRLRADALGRVLEMDETLEQAGVWDGSMLTIGT